MTTPPARVPDAPAGPPEHDKANPIIALACRRPVGLVMIGIAVTVFGVIAFLQLPMDLMPDVSYPSVTVRTSYPGAAPEDVEDRVTRRLEQALSVVRGLRRIHSSSRAESSDVTLEFSWDTDMKASLQEIREKLDQTFLPDEAESPTILRYDPNLDPVLQIGLTGDLDLKVLRTLGEEEVERRLESTDGVAAVRVRGGLEDEVRVAVSEELIRSRGITLGEISQRLAEENLDQASGLLTEGDVSYVVRTRNELTTVEEIASVPIRREGDSVIRLGDVARVYSTHREREVITRIDGQPAVRIEVFREAGANIVELAARVKERLYGTEEQRQQLEKWRRQVASGSAADLISEDTGDGGRKYGGGRRGRGRPGRGNWGGGGGGWGGGEQLSRPDFIQAYLPEDVGVVILSDQSTFIRGSIIDLMQTAALGGLLAVLVLYLFLGRASYTAIVAVSIPFSVIATFAPMNLSDISLNIMSLGGLALGVGMLVDSSIVVLEAVFRRRQEGLEPLEAAVRGASEVGGAVLASTLTTVAVFFPIVFVEGMAGQVFRDQSLTVVYSLMASLVASLTLIPMLAGRLGRAGSSQGSVSYWAPLFVARARWGFGFLARAWHPETGSIARGLLVLPLVVVLFTPYLLIATVLEVTGYALFSIAFALLAMLSLGRYLARAMGVLSKPVLTGFQAAYSAVERTYTAFLGWSLAHRSAVLLAAVLSLVLAVGAGRQLGMELIPTVAQGEFTVHVRYPVGTPLASTESWIADNDRRLAALPQVAAVATTIGVDPEDVQATDEGDHTARFQIRLGRTREAVDVAEDAVIHRAKHILGGVADHTLEIRRPALFSFRTPVEVEVRGYSLEVLRDLGRQVQTLLEKMPGVKDVRSSVARGNPEYHIYPDREKCAKYGITSQQISDVLMRKNMGDVATRFRKGERRIDVRVQLEEGDRQSIEALLDVVVAQGPDGGVFTLRDLVADWEVKEGPAEIRRVRQQRAAVISAELSGVDLGRTAHQIEAVLARELVLPPEFTADVVGQKEEMEESRDSLIAALALAIFLVYVVMASQFESLVQPFIILFTIPLAGVGVMVSLYLSGTSLSIMSFIGMIVLTGIVVNNAIVLIDQINRLRLEGHPLRQAVLQGGRRRLRPILMTTATTVLGMIPLTGVLAGIEHGPSWDWLLGTGQGAEIRSPLAYTVIGGLLSSTLLTLVVIPVVYSLVVRDVSPASADDREAQVSS